jgi:hypothetical protein
MVDWHFLNIVTHVIAGMISLTCGLAAVTTVKGGGPHRLAGRVFVGFGAVVLVSALFGVVVFDGPAPLAAASLAAGYQYLSGLRALALKTQGPGWIDFALAVAGVTACGFYWLTMGAGTRSWSPEIGYGALGFVGAVIVYDLSRYAWRGIWLRHVRPFDHGVKMTNVYFGMLSAGIGNTMRDFQPWSQLLPTALGLFVVIGLVLAHLRKRARPDRVSRASSAGTTCNLKDREAI